MTLKQYIEHMKPTQNTLICIADRCIFTFISEDTMTEDFATIHDVTDIVAENEIMCIVRITCTWED